MGSLAGLRRGPVRTTPAGITDASIFTAEQRAIGQFGATAAGIGAGLVQQRNDELARSDFFAMKAGTAAARNQFLQSLRTTEESYDEINKRWGEFKKKNFKTIGNTTKQRKAQRAYGDYIRGIIPAWDKDIDNIAWGVSAKRAQVKFFNSAVETLRTAPDFNKAVFDTAMAAEVSNLLTPENEELALANAVIDTNPQWYLDNVDDEKMGVAFDLLTSNQKRTLETKARESINRIRNDQQRAVKTLNDETRKTASELWRKNELTSNWLETNRGNMAASDFERYNEHLIRKANAEKKFQANLTKIEDPFNREIFGKIDAANTIAELEELKRTVNQYVSPEQKKLSVEEGKKWTKEIDNKLDELIVTEAEGFIVWSALDDKITAVQANPTRTNIDALSKEIDEAVISAPGQAALITVRQATKLQGRLSGIERNPAVKSRPSLSRAHTSLGRLRSAEVGEVKKPLNKEGLPEIIAIENKYSRLGADLDEYADTIASDKDFDNKINEKLRELTEPVAEAITLNFLERLIFAKEATPILGKVTGRTEEVVLVQKKIKALEKEPFWKNLTDEDKAAIEQRLIQGDTVADIKKLAAGPTPTIRRGGTTRNDGTEKGLGFFGELKLGGRLANTDTVSTEFSIGTTDVTGEELEIPTLVPTLTKKEIDLMINDIIPNGKTIPKEIIRKAVAHAKKRIKQGKSPFAQTGEQLRLPK